MNRRLFSMIGTPILALIAASIYTEWRAGKTALEVEQFCKAFTPGLTAQEFAKIALAHGYTVNDLGAGAPNLMASKVAYTCLLYTSPSPRDVEESRMPSSA